MAWWSIEMIVDGPRDASMLRPHQRSGGAGAKLELIRPARTPRSVVVNIHVEHTAPGSNRAVAVEHKNIASPIDRERVASHLARLAESKLFVGRERQYES